MHRIPFFVASFTISATALYYLTSITPLLLGIAGILAGIATALLAPRSSSATPLLPSTMRERAALLVSTTLSIGIIVFASRHASTDTLLSPWQLFPDWIFAIYALSALGLYVGMRTASRAGWWSFVLLLFTTTSVASFVYSLGYGFDGFIHRVTMETIARDGAIFPRTPYYIGAYMLEIALHMLTQVRLFIIDQWFVPVAAALTIPFALFIADIRARAALLALALPLTFFITTTPQSVALLFLILALAYANIATRSWRTWLLAYLLALAACAAHPIAGIPALLLTTITALWGQHKAASSILATIGSLALPAIFIVAQGAHISWTSARDMFIELIAAPELVPGVSMPLQFSYTYLHVALPIAIVAIAIYGWLVMRPRVAPWLLGAASCLAASLLLRCLIYRNVISYEQSAFSDRLFSIALIAVFPAIALTITHLATTWHWDRRSRVNIAIFFAITAAASWYLTYPRVDIVDRSKGYSTSAADFDTVAAIDRDTSGTASYIVLTNQSVSAAAVATFGFRPTVQLEGAEQFIYPIPTGGPLYPYYLQMVYGAPTREHALRATHAAAVERVYLVITPYWHNARQLIEQATTEADDTFAVGANRIFVYQLDPSLK